MTEDKTYMELSPTEILIDIFTFLTPKERAKCRQICWRWKLIIDNLSNNEGLWRKNCKSDFKNIYSTAYNKRLPGLNWCNIYRSLTLWSKLDQAEELRDEFASKSGGINEINDFQVLGHGVIGVHKIRGIHYYDLETLKPSRRTSISGDFINYTENDDTLILQGFDLNLFVIRKVITNIHYETNIKFGKVKTYLLVNQDLFYITLNNEVFLCKLQDEILKSVLLNRTNNNIMSIGYDNGRLNLLSYQRDIFTVIGKELVYQKTLDSSSNLLHELKKYNLVETLDWRVYLQWLFVLKLSMPRVPLHDIIIIKTYGEVVFTGSRWGVFRIYYAPYRNNEFDIFNSEPVKEYNFMKPIDCPIIQIDVIEGNDSHTILVAMPKKIAVLSYKHNFKGTTSVATLPYKEIQNIKIINDTE